MKKTIQFDIKQYLKKKLTTYKIIELVVLFCLFSYGYLWLVQDPLRYSYEPNRIIHNNLTGETFYDMSSCGSDLPINFKGFNINGKEVHCEKMLGPVPFSYKFLNEIYPKIQPWILWFCGIYLTNFFFVKRKGIMQFIRSLREMKQ